MNLRNIAQVHAEWVFAALGHEAAALIADHLLLQLSTLCTTDGSPLPPALESLKTGAGKALEALRGSQQSKIITPPPGLRVVKS